MLQYSVLVLPRMTLLCFIKILSSHNEIAVDLIFFT